MMEYFYRIYGLRVQSQIPFSEAVPETAGEAEVKIVFGRMPDFLLEAGQKGYGTWTNGFVSAWFRIRDGTQVYVEGGSRITVELSEEPQLLVITSLLLSAGMALVCLQRGEPFFHGSALYTGEQAILLCGESGAGKSTVAMELLQRKLGFLADDTVRVHPGTMGMLAEPSYPQQKLCRDMALKCGKPLEELIYLKTKMLASKEISGHEILQMTKEICNQYLFFMKKYRLPVEENFMENFSISADNCADATELFDYLTRRLTSSYEKASRLKRQDENRPIRLVKKYVEEHFGEPLTLEEVSQIADLSPTYLSTLFKKDTGITFLEYLSKVRMDMAKKLLKETNDTVADICGKVGYSDVRYFTKSFTKYAGLKPKEYRKLYS